MLVMELVEGANLREVLAQGRLSPSEAMEIIPQLCEALSYAHETGVVHRDIKPENLLFDGRGRLKITDFGLAKLLGKTSQDAHMEASHEAAEITDPNASIGVVGTIHYMAAEQLENPKSVDHRADIYAMGVVFYEMLTGELPIGRFEPPSQRVAEETVRTSLAGSDLRIDVRLDEVVLRALQKQPEKRYNSASELMEDIDSIEAPESAVSKAKTKAAALASKVSGATDGSLLDFAKRVAKRIARFAAWLRTSLIREPRVDVPALLSVTVLLLGSFIASAVLSGPRGEAPGLLIFGLTVLGSFALARVALRCRKVTETKEQTAASRFAMHSTLSIAYSMIIGALVIGPIVIVLTIWFMLLHDLREPGEVGWVREWINLACVLSIVIGGLWLALSMLHRTFPKVGMFLFAPYLRPWTWKPFLLVTCILLAIMGAAAITLPQTWYRPLRESDYVSEVGWAELSMRDIEIAKRKMRQRDSAESGEDQS